MMIENLVKSRLTLRARGRAGAVAPPQGIQPQRRILRLVVFSANSPARR